MSAESERVFARLVTAFSKDRDVTPPDPSRHSFGANALRVDGKIFAFLKGDALVLKLPSDRVAALIEAKHGKPFDANKGKPMKGWVMVVAGEHARWPRLAREALAFVRG